MLLSKDSGESTALAAGLARRILELSETPLPGDVAHQARRALVNVAGTAVAGARHPGSDAIVSTALRLAGAGSVRVPGRSERVSPYWASVATAFAAHVDDFDDTHLGTVIHPGAATLGAAVGAAGYAATAGTQARDTLRAFALGIEVQLRFGLALGPEHYAAGWHTTGTCGVMGAAVMAGLALGLRADQLAGALGVAASCTLGHREVFGSDGKAFHPGKAAANGLLAALAGARGIRSSDRVLEAPRGYFRVLSDAPRPEELLRDFGTRWHLLDLTYKPYPCGIVAHPAIDAAVQLSGTYRGRLRAIHVHCHPLVVDLMGVADPQSGLQGRFSTPHAVASALLDGRFGLDHVTDAAARRPDIARLRRLVSLEVSPSLRRSEGAVMLDTEDGGTLGARVEAARGSMRAPLTDSDLSEKAGALLGLRLDPGAAAGVLGRMWAAADGTPLTGLVRAASLAGARQQAAGPRQQAARPPQRTTAPAEPAGTQQDAVTARLCEFAVTTRLEDIPEAARRAAARTLANALATALPAGHQPEIVRLAGTLGALSAATDTTPLGGGARLPALWAALAGGMAIHIQDFDDTHLAADAHVGATVLPAALAAAEMSGADGVEMMAAIAVGMEVALRVALGVVPAHFDRGWHVTSTVGRIGAAVAAGRILGLDAGRLRAAVGLAATQAGGLQAAFGSPVKAWHAGKAAADGLEAALLAAAGLTGPPGPLEGRRGFASIMSARPRPDRMTALLGETWQCAQLSFKPYACGVVAHPAVDAAVTLRGKLPPGPPGVGAAVAGVAGVVAGVNPVVLDVMGIAEPATGLQGKFSVVHCVAAGLLDGYAGPRQFTDERVQAGDARQLRRIIRVRADRDLAKDAAWLLIRLRDGGELRHRVDHARGSIGNPLTDTDIRAKANRGAGPDRAAAAGQVMDLAFGLETLPSAEPLLAAIRMYNTTLPPPG